MLLHYYVAQALILSQQQVIISAMRAQCVSSIVTLVVEWTSLSVHHLSPWAPRFSRLLARTPDWIKHPHAYVSTSKTSNSP